MIGNACHAGDEPALQIDQPFIRIEPGQRCLRGALTVPGDKSISHRALIFGVLANGTSAIDGMLDSEDVQATSAALRAMGASISASEDGRLHIQGGGLGALRQPQAPLDLGNSGTSMRLLAGVAAARPWSIVLTGDDSLSTRDMMRIAEPLRRMGALVTTSPSGTPPLRIEGRYLQGIDYVPAIASAQIKSCVLLAGLQAAGVTRICEPIPTRDHTERMLSAFGAAVEREGDWIGIRGGCDLRGAHIKVPGDISSAAFFIVGALIGRDCDVIVRDVGVNPSRSGVIDLLRRMGGDVTVIDKGCIGGEPVADIRARSSRLHGIRIPADGESSEIIVRAIDELPIVFIAAACAKGATVVRGAGELRKKESDRLNSMSAGLRAIGITVQTVADGIDIEGGRLQGGRIDSCNDHRVAMSFAIAALAAESAIEITGHRTIASSFPGFIRLARQAGLVIHNLSIPPTR